MNKGKLLAARRKLKEFQQYKSGHSRGDKQEHTDPLKHTNDQVLRGTPENLSPSPQQNIALLLEKQLELKGNHSNDTININPESQQNHVVLPTEWENKTVQNSLVEHELTHNNAEVSSFNNFVPQHSRNGSNSTASSQIVHENTDQDNISLHSSTRPIEHYNVQSNITNSPSSSLQKKHLLQMANAVANVLDHEQNLDESTLNNCDLEQRNQFLVCCLEEQKKLVSQLHVQVSQSNNKIAELEAKLSTKSADYESRLIQELNPLREQIQLDAQTIGILVGEKAELTAANAQCQTTIRQKTEDVTELFGKFKNSQYKITELDKELSSIKSNMEELSNAYIEIRKKYEETLEMSATLKKQNEEFEQETSELRQNLNYKNTELSNLQQELQEKVALLSLSELRIQQLSNIPQEMNALENQHHATKILEQQLSRMKEALESVSGEKDEVSKKYQSYVQQLDERHSKLMTELDISKKKIEESEIREQSYVQRLSELDQQLQREKAKTMSPVEDQSDKIAILTKNVDNLVLEQEHLQLLLNEKDNEIKNLKKDLKELQDFKEQSAEASKLAQALQSEQLGASRAVSQNQQLKLQLDEMHDAFIALSNTKLDLTEQLQAERVIGKKLNAQLNELENQMDELKNQLAKKEAELVEFEKERLHAAQIEDQIQHYQAQSHNAVPLQQELQKALLAIETLTKENQSLVLKLQTVESTTIANVEIHREHEESVSDTTFTSSSNANESSDSATMSASFVNANCYSVESGVHNQSENVESSAIHTNNSKTESVISETNIIPRVSEPMKKLEIRFKETMERVAELTNEKQRLEHLVLQLQAETETIGDYVTLYQKQRAILQEKAKEKENTFRQLLEQRNQQQEQLHKLKVLVADLLKAKNSNANVTTATAAEENMRLVENPVDSETNDIEVIQGHVNKIDETINQTDKTTSQILDLLSEIKDCGNSCIMEPNFHPCPWCSGKLITV